MAGTPTSATQNSLSLIGSQINGFNPSAIATQGSQLASYGSSALGASAQLSSSIPIIGSFIGAGIGIMTAIFAAHSKKVKAEAGELNNAVPIFESELQAIIQQYEAGQFDENQAIAFVNQAVALYYQGVGSQAGAPIKGVWHVPATGDPAHATPPNPCNGPCVVGHFIEIDAFDTINAFSEFRDGISTSKTFNITTLPPHAGFSGKQGGSITITKTSVITSTLNSLGLSSLTAAIPASLKPYLTIAAVALGLLFVFRMAK